MKTINQIAKINLSKIYGTDSSFRAVNFHDYSYDLNRVLCLFDTRTLAEVEAEEENFPFPVEFPEDGEITDLDPDSIDELYVWGIRLGEREIPMYSGSKSIIDRIVEEEEKTCWIENGYHFTHLVIERRVAIENSYPVWEADVYRISGVQWKEIMNKIHGFEIFT